MAVVISDAAYAEIKNALEELGFYIDDHEGMPSYIKMADDAVKTLESEKNTPYISQADVIAFLNEILPTFYIGQVDDTSDVLQVAVAAFEDGKVSQGFLDAVREWAAQS